MARDRKTLGDILLEQGLIDKEALSHALRLQQRRLGEILIEENLVTPVEIAAALKLQARSVVPGSNLRVSLETTKLDRLLLDLEDFEKELLRGGNRELLAASLGSARKKMEDLLFDSTVTFGARARKAVERTAEILQKSVDFHYRAVEVLVDRAFSRRVMGCDPPSHSQCDRSWDRAWRPSPARRQIAVGHDSD